MSFENSPKYDHKLLIQEDKNSKSDNNQSKTYQTLVSIITVTYNAEKFIEKTIQSVLNQTYHDYEYIIIDGGSIDETLNIIQKYQSKITHWISEPDKGIYDAMNKGIALSSGDIIGLLNAGDTYLPNALSLLVKQFVPSDNLSIYYGDIYLGYTDANITIKSLASIDRLKYSMTICHQAIFITKHTYLNQGLYNPNYKYASDYAYVLSLLLLGAEFHYLDGVVAYYQTGGVSDHKIFNLKLEYIRIHRNLKSPFLYRALILYIQELFSYYFYKIVGYFFGKQKAAEFRRQRLMNKYQTYVLQNQDVKSK
ncbi:MAG: glycosyltransferase family 2 protein [Nostoc sp.]|uniref:glycosyltransferase family 2 protein n=1 Tax=Nostoc sp. TaxID=1180 RepID=UPI002FF9EDC6